MNIKMKKNLLALMLILLVFACEERKNYDEDLPKSLNIITSLKGNQAKASIDDLQGIINLVLPPKSDITKVTLDVDAPEGVTLNPKSGSVVNLTQPIDITASYNGNTRSYKIYAKVLPSEIAFLGNKETYEELIRTSDDDVIAAAKWLKSTYDKDFKYYDIHKITYEDLEKVNVVMFYYDQVGTSELPSEFVDNKSPLVQYLVKGGKLLLGGMATSYAQVLGRDKSNLLKIQGNGPGFTSTDTWSIDGGVNFVSSKLNHPIYTYNPGLITFDSNGYIPIIDAGYREDHNNMWDAAPLLSAGHQPGQFNAFEEQYGGKVLGVWSGVTDECCPGIVEFIPNSVYSGRIIAIGIGGMEWNMNDGRVNKYEGNVKGIYKNSIDYLSTI